MASGEQIEQLLRDLGRAVSQVMSTSPEVVTAVRRLQQQGYELGLLLDHPKDELKTRIPLIAPEAPPASPPLRVPAVLSRHASADFCIDGGDVLILRALGIDPTRKIRNKKK
jgi:hypothetical protein